MQPTAILHEPPRRDSADSELAVNALLHEHATSIRNLSALVRDVLACIGTAPFEVRGEPRCDELRRAIRPLLAALESELSCAFAATGRKPDGPIALLASRVHGLVEETNDKVLVHRAKACAQELLKHIAAEDSRLRSVVVDIIRVSTVAELLKAESNVMMIAEQTRVLRDVALAAVRSPELTRTVDFRLLVERAVNDARAYAESRRIDLNFNRKPRRGNPLLVTVQQSDVQRALSNLLSNAIKYSYTLSGNLRAWVDIKVYKADGKACAEFENWGVPIVADDFGKDRLFTPRYRGRQALEEGRAGTGIGLWDARETARRHGGDVRVASTPARNSEAYDASTRPYITRVILAVASNH